MSVDRLSRNDLTYLLELTPPQFFSERNGVEVRTMQSREI